MSFSDLVHEAGDRPTGATAHWRDHAVGNRRRVPVTTADDPADQRVVAALGRNGNRATHQKALHHSAVGAAIANLEGSLRAHWATVAAMKFLVLTATRSGEHTSSQNEHDFGQNEIRSAICFNTAEVCNDPMRAKFDPSRLDQARTLAIELANKVKATKNHEDAWDCGEALRNTKVLTPHGQVGLWLIRLFGNEWGPMRRKGWWESTGCVGGSVA